MKTLEVHPEAKGLIFDLDGTLVDSMPIHYLAWKEVCDRVGVEFTEKMFYDLAGVPSDRIIEIFNERDGTNFDPKEMSLLKEETYLKKIAGVETVPAVMNIVERYHGKLPMAIGTGSPKEHSWVTVKAKGLDRFFDILVSKDDVIKGKPDPETFVKCAEAIGIAHEYCQVFEDGEPGLEAARIAGMISTDIRPFLVR